VCIRRAKKLATYPHMPDRIVGDVKYLLNMQSRRLNHPRDVMVWLPPSYYVRSRARYPVLYMHDGQNLIDPGTAFLGVDWKVDETVTRLIGAGRLKELIIVGIYNTPAREKEYTGAVWGRNYARFVVEELKPLIDSRFRTRTHAKDTAVLGSSLGGLISFYFAWWYPQVFSMAGCMSPSLFWDDYHLLREVNRYRGPKKPLKLYLDVGSGEYLLQPGYEKMTKLLVSKGYRKGSDLQYHFARKADHNEAHWGKRIWRPLVFFFPSVTV
jgi:predicted alpha/beta superfamily hydrolase